MLYTGVGNCAASCLPEGLNCTLTALRDTFGYTHIHTCVPCVPTLLWFALSNQIPNTGLRLQAVQQTEIGVSVSVGLPSLRASTLCAAPTSHLLGQLPCCLQGRSRQQQGKKLNCKYRMHYETSGTGWKIWGKIRENVINYFQVFLFQHTWRVSAV